MSGFFTRLGLVLLCFGAGWSPHATAMEPDWSLYQELLNQYLTPVSDATKSQGVALSWVDYSGLKTDAKFDLLLDQLAVFSPQQLRGADEQMAFYINAYNILAISLVRQHWPLNSIKQAGSWYRPVWKADAGLIGNLPISLDSIEHKILRPQGDPRIHFAIVCASLSCPDLRAEPYRATLLQHQLNDQASRYINNSTKGLQSRNNGVYLSKIFDWFEADFGGESEMVRWISRFRQPDLEQFAGYLDYNWSVNGD